MVATGDWRLQRSAAAPQYADPKRWRETAGVRPHPNLCGTALVNRLNELQQLRVIATKFLKNLVIGYQDPLAAADSLHPPDDFVPGLGFELVRTHHLPRLVGRRISDQRLRYDVLHSAQFACSVYRDWQPPHHVIRVEADVLLGQIATRSLRQNQIPIERSGWQMAVAVAIAPSKWITREQSCG